MAPVVKSLPASSGDARDMGSIPGLGRFPGVGHGNSLQYSCMGNHMDRGSWQAAVSGIAKTYSPPRIKPVSPALAGGFFTTEPPGKPYMMLMI